MPLTGLKEGSIVSPHWAVTAASRKGRVALRMQALNDPGHWDNERIRFSTLTRRSEALELDSGALCAKTLVAANVSNVTLPRPIRRCAHLGNLKLAMGDQQRLEPTSIRSGSTSRKPCPRGNESARNANVIWRWQTAGSGPMATRTKAERLTEIFWLTDDKNGFNIRRGVSSKRFPIPLRTIGNCHAQSRRRRDGDISKVLYSRELSDPPDVSS
jgi:hypothetical protein